MPTNTGNLNLYLNAGTPKPKSKSLNLALQSSTSGTKFEHDNLPLYIQGEPFSSSLNLYLLGYDDPYPTDTYMNLYLKGGGLCSTTNSLNLVTWGSSGGVGQLSLNTMTLEQLNSLTLEELYHLPLYDTKLYFNGYYNYNTLPLYIEGKGVNENYIPSSSWMNLVIQTVPGLESNIPLFIQGSPIQSGLLHLYTAGVSGFNTGSLDLYLDSIGVGDSRLDLFARGYSGSF